MSDYRSSDGFSKTYTTKDAVIASGASLSAVIDIEQLNVTGFLMPASWTAAKLTFQVSADGVTFGNAKDSAGNEIQVTVAAGEFIGVNLAELSGARFIKVRSGLSGAAVNQAADRTITLVLTTNAETSTGVSSGNLAALINASVTRPADTTAYAAGDVVTDSTSAPTVITFTSIARDNNKGGVIVAAQLIDSANKATKGIFELWLFDTTFTPDNDNAVFTPTDAELETLIGVIPFDVSYVGDATADAGGNAVYQSSIVNLPFKTGASSRNLFGILVVRNAYTPVSAEKFTVRLEITQEQ